MKASALCDYLMNLVFRFSFAYAWRVGFMKRQVARETREAEMNGYLPRGGMHPPAFRPSQRLLDWPNCRLEMHCGICGSTVLSPTKLIAERHGNQTFSEVLGRVKCRRCGIQPESVYLCAGHRKQNGGAPSDWVIELRSPPRSE